MIEKERDVISNKIAEYSELLIKNCYKLGFEVLNQEVELSAMSDCTDYRVKCKYFEKIIKQDNKAIYHIDKKILVKQELFGLMEDLMDYELQHLEEKEMYDYYKEKMNRTILKGNKND